MVRESAPISVRALEEGLGAADSSGGSSKWQDLLRYLFTWHHVLVVSALVIPSVVKWRAARNGNNALANSLDLYNCIIFNGLLNMLLFAVKIHDFHLLRWFFHRDCRQHIKKGSVVCIKVLMMAIRKVLFCPITATARLRQPEISRSHVSHGFVNEYEHDNRLLRHRLFRMRPARVLKTPEPPRASETLPVNYSDEEEKHLDEPDMISAMGVQEKEKEKRQVEHPSSSPSKPHEEETAQTPESVYLIDLHDEKNEKLAESVHPAVSGNGDDEERLVEQEKESKEQQDQLDEDDKGPDKSGENTRLDVFVSNPDDTQAPELRENENEVKEVPEEEASLPHTSTGELEPISKCNSGEPASAQNTSTCSRCGKSNLECREEACTHVKSSTNNLEVSRTYEILPSYSSLLSYRGKYYYPRRSGFHSLP